jgi:putative ABC transport system substrate-binding protein
MSFDRLRRREFITVIGGAATWPLIARAQQPAVPVIGFLEIGLPDVFAHLLPAYRKGLGESGFVEGRNVAIEFRWAGDRYDRLPTLAADLVHRGVAVITAGGNVAADAAKSVTSTIPIVFVTGVDPVTAGLVASLNRPGGNVTGIANITGELGAKRLDLLRRVVPKAAVIGMLVNSSNADTLAAAREVEAAVLSAGQQFQLVTASAQPEIDVAFDRLAQRGAEALLVGSDSYLLNQRDRIVSQAASHSIPAIYNFAEFAAAGGLLSYGASRVDQWRQMGVYTGRILKGEKPADLPVLQPTKFELVINLKTAMTLGLSIPPTLLAIADEVIE